MRTLLASIVILVALPASADIPDPTEFACRGKAPGVACTLRDDKPGVCAKTTCGRARGPDYPCTRCVPDPKKEKNGAAVDEDPTSMRLAGAGVGLLALGIGLFVARRSARRRPAV